MAGPAARAVLTEERRHVYTRHELNRRRLFRELSPQPGMFREAQLEGALRDEDGLELLVELARAAEPDLQRLARRLAGRVLVRFAHSPAGGQAGVGRLRRSPYRPGMDIDLDASLGALVEARARGGLPGEDELRGEGWSRRATAIALLVDRSGSMGGGRVLAAALAAAVVAQRTGDDYSVIAFADDAVVVKAQDEDRTPEQVVDDVLSLVGYGMTDIALALRAAREQLSRSRAQRRVAVLLSDCRATAGGDPIGEAAALDEVLVLAPPGDSTEGTRLARAGHGRLVELAGPLAVPAALSALMTGGGEGP